MEKGIIFIISGPSGSGKSTIINEFLKKHKNDFFLSISATTREPRKSEIDGKDYYFYTKEKFKELIKKDMFLEYAKILGNFYGTPKKPIFDAINKGKNVIMDIDIQGVKKIRKKLKFYVTIFIIPPSFKELEKRLNKRKTDSKKSINERLKLAKKELKERNSYDYIIVNKNIKETVNMLEYVVKFEKLRNYKI